MNEIGWVGGYNRREVGHGKDLFELHVITFTWYLQWEISRIFFNFMNSIFATRKRKQNVN